MSAVNVTMRLQMFTLTETGLVIDDHVTFDEWVAYGKELDRGYSRFQWGLGDWLNSGERLFGEMYAQALDTTEYSYGTLRNYASICRRIPQSIRSPKLLFHQSKYVAQIEEIDVQARILDYAAEHKLSGDAIKAIVDSTLKKKPRPEKLYILKGHEYHSNADGTIHVDLGRNVGKVFIDVWVEQ